MSSVNKSFAFLFAVSLSNPSASLGGPCDTIITHGLRNISVAYSEDALVASKYEKACNFDYSSMSDSQVADLEVEVLGYGSGVADYSRQRSEEKVKSWCSENKATAQQNQQDLQTTQTFHQGAVDAWQSCIALNAKDVFISPRISPDGRTVDLAIVYRGPPNQNVVLSGVPVNGFTCDIKDQNAAAVKFPVQINTSSVNVHCERVEPSSRIINDKAFEYLPRGTISVQTASDPFQLFFVEEYVPLAPDTTVAKLTSELARKELPIGTVVASVLTAEAFLNASGPYEVPKWVLADGSPLPVGTRYEALTGQKVAPDLRFMTGSRIVTEIINSPLSSGNQLASLAPAARSGDDWHWFAGPRDVTGNRANNDREQDVDQFQVYIDNGVVTAQGRTLNWKHNTWGSWNPGVANILGIATRSDMLSYYVKIN